MFFDKKIRETIYLVEIM